MLVKDWIGLDTHTFPKFSWKPFPPLFHWVETLERRDLSCSSLYILCRHSAWPVSAQKVSSESVLRMRYLRLREDKLGSNTAMARTHIALCSLSLAPGCLMEHYLQLFSEAEQHYSWANWFLTLAWVKHHQEDKFVVICCTPWNIFYSHIEMSFPSSIFKSHSLPLTWVIKDQLCLWRGILECHGWGRPQGSCTHSLECSDERV